jgi:hypothetical protein
MIGQVAELVFVPDSLHKKKETSEHQSGRRGRRWRRVNGGGCYGYPVFEIAIMEMRLNNQAQAGYDSAVHNVVERERSKGSAEKSKFTRPAVSIGAQLNFMAVLVPRKPLAWWLSS